MSFFDSKIPGLLCPKCERPLDGHDNDRCKRKLSRRFFLGAAAGVVIASCIPSSISSLEKLSLSPVAWFTGARAMFSEKNGCLVTSRLSEKRSKAIESEVEMLRRSGFSVMVSDSEDKLRMAYVKANSAKMDNVKLIDYLNNERLVVSA